MLIDKVILLGSQYSSTFIKCVVFYEAQLDEDGNLRTKTYDVDLIDISEYNFTEYKKSLLVSKPSWFVAKLLDKFGYNLSDKELFNKAEEEINDNTLFLQDYSSAYPLSGIIVEVDNRKIMTNVTYSTRSFYAEIKTSNVETDMELLTYINKTYSNRNRLPRLWKDKLKELLEPMPELEESIKNWITKYPNSVQQITR